LPSVSHDITERLLKWSDGDQQALAELMPLVYDELRRIAGRCLDQERADHTLQPTALAHEAYLRLVDLRQMRWKDRAHFFALAAELMRRILVDHARARNAERRGGGARKVALDEVVGLAAEREVDLIALDDALNSLARFDERKSRLVELRFFGGLSLDEAAEALGVSQATVVRDWALAKAWLRREINPDHH